MSDVERLHGPPCTAGKDGGPCTRCTGFLPGNEHRAQAGNELRVTHGAYATVKLGPRVAELADELRPFVPTYRPGDEVALKAMCLAVARIERTAEAISETTDPLELGRLRQDERGWANTLRRYLNDLGMSPAARAKLRLDVAMGTRVMSLTELVEQLDDGEAVGS